MNFDWELILGFFTGILYFLGGDENASRNISTSNESNPLAINRNMFLGERATLYNFTYLKLLNRIPDEEMPYFNYANMRIHEKTKKDLKRAGQKRRNNRILAEKDYYINRVLDDAIKTNRLIASNSLSENRTSD